MDIWRVDEHRPCGADLCLVYQIKRTRKMFCKEMPADLRRLLGIIASISVTAIIVAGAGVLASRTESDAGAIFILLLGAFSIAHLWRVRFIPDTLLDYETVNHALKQKALALQVQFQEEIKRQQQYVRVESGKHEEQRLEEAKEDSRRMKREWDNTIQAAHFLGFPVSSSHKDYLDKV